MKFLKQMKFKRRGYTILWAKNKNQNDWAIGVERVEIRPINTCSKRIDFLEMTI